MNPRKSAIQRYQPHLIRGSAELRTPAIVARHATRQSACPTRALASRSSPQIKSRNSPRCISLLSRGEIVESLNHGAGTSGRCVSCRVRLASRKNPPLKSATEELLPSESTRERRERHAGRFRGDHREIHGRSHPGRGRQPFSLLDLSRPTIFSR